ncbi:MAG: hypothetical protein A2087_02745 [Spirochaetes bacterium GWD1_61_31]|nr:MAG: hypothetical protein A2Y37_03475 [Spirochaetes bacterium GWB1_60_80]OHD29666.1 MAG: hypothetical protein A2004_02015 [Spirochaetes bacterium GWC1_61_12]OHD44145.1 MAG: hypothetical protein A2087_02745 [Spirochaetes bacterium GWD1_61_31]OHD46878.1 MAG: hypothetical protein A2Y35_02610 [Spirochaetes bacterium GWE1_60_18]OHD61815.1 MAG: hypothetical protein A2Y32_13735 [Spirochaetes bacterium GWF1_60_12]
MPDSPSDQSDRLDTRQLARLISQIERQDIARLGLLSVLHQRTGRAHIIGITGPPGSGKSTLTDKIIGQLRGRGRRVAVLAIDPSSPFTGGAILGDRIRMMRHATDEGVFIRSLASRGHLGGLSRAVAETIRAVDAAGFDDIIVETVGVGQSEVDIVRCADTVVLVAVPGLGDDIQAIKAGVMEIGDVFCVNKADRDGAERVVRETKAMLEAAVLNGAATRFSDLYRAAGQAETATAPATDRAAVSGTHHVAKLLDDPHHAHLRIPAVLLTVAEQGEGVAALVDEIKSHYGLLLATGLLEQHRCDNTAWELRNTVSDRLLAFLDADIVEAALARLAGGVVRRERDFYQALDELFGTVLAVSKSAHFNS